MTNITSTSSVKVVLAGMIISSRSLTASLQLTLIGSGVKSRKNGDRSCRHLPRNEKRSTNFVRHRSTSTDAILAILLCVVWISRAYIDFLMYNSSCCGSYFRNGERGLSAYLVEAFVGGGSTRATAVGFPKSCHFTRRRCSGKGEASEQPSNIFLAATIVGQNRYGKHYRRRGAPLQHSNIIEDGEDDDSVPTDDTNKMKSRNQDDAVNGRRRNYKYNKKGNKKDMKRNDDIYNASTTGTDKRKRITSNHKPKNGQQLKSYHYSSGYSTNSTTSKNSNYHHNTTNISSKKRKSRSNSKSTTSPIVKDMKNRITQLERLVAAQTVELLKLRQECKDLTEAATAFTQVVELLRQAGLTTKLPNTSAPISNSRGDSKTLDSHKDVKTSSREAKQQQQPPVDSNGPALVLGSRAPEYEYFDDSEIFGKAPTSVIDAADAAGAAILAAMLAGKLRMLVDVRDAELNTNPDTLVQFIELAILPVAAGLEGLSSAAKDDEDDDEEGRGGDTKENQTNTQQYQQPDVQYHHRVKVVLPTVSKLLEYRKSMCLSAPDVVALSVLGFGSVEEKDNLVVFIAPSPDNEEGLQNMMDILNPKNPLDKLRQPVVVLNHHMLPLPSYYSQNFEVVYHLRLLSVQYMATTGSTSSNGSTATTGDELPSRDYIERLLEAQRRGTIVTITEEGETKEDSLTEGTNITSINDGGIDVAPSERKASNIDDEYEGHVEENDEALEAAMTHAYGTGIHQGLTRAMVIRAYPR